MNSQNIYMSMSKQEFMTSIIVEVFFKQLSLYFFVLSVLIKMYYFS